MIGLLVSLAFLVPQDDVEQLKKRIAELTRKLEIQEKRIADLEKKLEFLARKGKDDSGESVVRDGPPGNPWAGFQKDDFSSYSTVIQTADTKMTTETRYTVTKMTEETASFTVKNVLVIAGKEMVTETPMEIPLTQEEEKPVEGEKPESGRETITVSAGKFDCRWTRTRVGETTTTVWMNSKVPGGVVRIVTEGTSNMTMELKEYKGKKE